MGGIAEQQLEPAIEGLERIETTPVEEMKGVMSELTHAVYPHDQLYGDYCAVHDYINCPPEQLHQYMSNIYSLEEWTYSLRNFKTSQYPDVYQGEDRIGRNTKIFCKVVSNASALTVDYHCAWDQGEHLWMVYLNRIVPAQLVLDRPGSVLFWQNCRHPNYDKNPYPQTAPPNRPWVGDFWDVFYAGHSVELWNLKYIVEYRYAQGQAVEPSLLIDREI
jgi:uncharacterized protein (UPF0335 family)